ncbi:MAG: ribonuclease R [Proteobacteria bacterium]|nr:ribonuclease R [Pseudomonadota bacterium]
MNNNRDISRHEVLAVLERAAAAGLRAGEIAEELGVVKKEQYRLRKLLTDLVAQGDIERIGGGTYTVRNPDSESQAGRQDRRFDRAGAGRPGTVADDAPDPSTTGRITVHPAGYGFVSVDHDGETVYVPAKYRGPAMDGDRVELTTWQGYKGIEGQVVRVLSRGRAKLTGRLRKVGRTIVLEPDDPRIATDYGFVPLVDSAPPGKVDQAAAIEICRYPTEARPELVGRLQRILGDPDDPRTEIEKILICADVPDEFPEAAVAQADSTPDELSSEDFADRIDLRDRLFFTIDPEDARDFDDALCVEEGPDGIARIWVAIADVSHYVHTDDAIDREASVRGVSVYLPDRVVPMLPAPLSSGICSLMPDVDRCAVVARLDIGKDGTVRETRVAAAVIRSRARLDYPGVAAALAGDFRGRRMHYRRHAGALHKLDGLAQKMRARRVERGSLMLEIPEAKVLLDDDDPRLIRDIVRTKSRPKADQVDAGPIEAGNDDVRRAYQLVEEFMIAANEAVGRFFDERDLPVIWRVHAPPEQERVEQLAEIFASYGIDLDVERLATPRGLKDAMEQIADRAEARALSSLILRSLKQAVYDVRPIGHFGLASSHYLHFTSPIRRYPDLLVHRLLKAALHREGHASGGGAAIAIPDQTILAELAQTASAHERRALDAERETVAMFRAYFMRETVGEEFTGRISAVTSFGAFIELDDPFVEGLVKVDEIGGDTFTYDPVAMRLTGRHTGLALSLGDTVLVEVTNVSVPLRRIDFRLLSVGGKAPDDSEPARRRGSRKKARERD